MMIYGFGSYFLSMKSYQDIDLLIVHASISYDSCVKAINLKRLILREVDNASVTMLSKYSEKDVNFIETSKAVLLWRVDENEPCIEDIINKINWFREK